MTRTFTARTAICISEEEHNAEREIKIKKLEKEIEPIVEEEFNKWKIENGFVDKDGKPAQAVMGSCHAKWAIKKRLMKEKYDIDWKTPAEEHPEITFD